MQYGRQRLRWAGVLVGTIMLLSSCTYNAAVRRMSPAEQEEFYTYSKIMTGSQTRAYLAKATAAERTAYLSEIGLAQRFQALDPLDRETVLNGLPRAGMSAEALLFIWGEPYYIKGDSRRYAHWYYLGSSFSMGTHGNQYTYFGTRVDVYLVDGKVVAWVDYAPDTETQGGDDIRR